MTVTIWFKEIIGDLPVLDPTDGDEINELIEEVFPFDEPQPTWLGDEAPDAVRRVTASSSIGQPLRSINRSLDADPDTLG